MNNNNKKYYDFLFKFLEYLEDITKNYNEIKKYINSLKKKIKLYRIINSNEIINNNYEGFKNYKKELYNSDIYFFLNLENKEYSEEIKILKKIYNIFKENNIKLDIVWQYVQSLFFLSEKIYLKKNLKKI